MNFLVHSSDEFSTTSSEEEETGDSGRIKMNLNGVRLNSSEIFSPVHRISGFPWRLRIAANSNGFIRHASLHCDKSSESYLWKCNVSFTISIHNLRSVFKNNCRADFSSWKGGHSGNLIDNYAGRSSVTKVEVEMRVIQDGERFRKKSIFTGGDVTLKINGIGFRVVKKCLADQSPYFEELFFGNFKESNYFQVEIKDVTHEEFSNLLDIIYGNNKATVSIATAKDILKLADRFELKIITDMVENFILSSPLSIHKKLFLSDKYGLGTLQKEMLREYKISSNLIQLSRSVLLDRLSPELTRTLFIKSCRKIDELIDR
ncbi:hypothetical protein PFISCL1PPCAC_12263 [Pristionchus fissidentatus]|uniref:BTB domain-containing protein n=1 Tax=Pristionchus fissidentatus TaxID=1538716 RepID=A0AAV5VNG9_9BILA|nr:hypothetical protein PFISCL1PPCAC_12263 [Pristionchus fissidentatus]